MKASPQPEKAAPQEIIRDRRLEQIAVTPQFEILFDTVRSSRKYPNLIARPACSFVIGGWGSREQTVQYEGAAEELKPPHLEAYREIYFGTFPDGRARMSWPGIVWFVVRPRWIRYSDFDQNPPLIEEFTFGEEIRTA